MISHVIIEWMKLVKSPRFRLVISVECALLVITNMVFYINIDDRYARIHAYNDELTIESFYLSGLLYRLDAGLFIATSSLILLSFEEDHKSNFFNAQHFVRLRSGSYLMGKITVTVFLTLLASFVVFAAYIVIARLSSQEIQDILKTRGLQILFLEGLLVVALQMPLVCMSAAVGSIDRLSIATKAIIVAIGYLASSIWRDQQNEICFLTKYCDKSPLVMEAVYSIAVPAMVVFIITMVNFKKR